MPKKAPGKSYREGLSLTKLFKMFPDDETAERWFIETRWPNGVACPNCGSANIANCRKPQPYRCRDCRKSFSVKTGTLMHSSNPRWSLQNRPMVVTAKAANGDGPGQCCFTPLNRYRASPFWYASSGDRT